MTADERARSDRRKRGDEGAEDAREEYTSYRETEPDAPADPEAEREADLQPDSDDNEEEETEER